ncbi:TraU family protein [Orbus wheelerorum]|uniref:TraU family protein n=1 Tax=Orbus wheelerorum TaxID=3074111 RepID=UPI00370CFEC8
MHTNTSSFHVSKNYTKSKSKGFWPPEPVRENTHNHKWQKLAPSMSMSCGTFPSLNDVPSVDGGYVYALWRPYSCCKKRGQTFLYSIDIQ